MYVFFMAIMRCLYLYINGLYNRFLFIHKFYLLFYFKPYKMKCDYVVWDSAYTLFFCIMILFFVRNGEIQLFNQFNIKMSYQFGTHDRPTFIIFMIETYA